MVVFRELCLVFFFSSRRRHTRLVSDWSSDVCSSDLGGSNEWTSAVAAGARFAVAEVHSFDPPAVHTDRGVYVARDRVVDALGRQGVERKGGGEGKGGGVRASRGGRRKRERDVAAAGE